MSLLPVLERELPRRRILDGRYRRDAHYVSCEDDFDRVRRQDDPEARFRPAIAAICQRHGVPAETLRKFPGGFNLVFAAGDRHVVKLYCPYFPEDCDIEAAALEALDGQLTVTTPGAVARGDLEGWPYLVMGRLPGVELRDIWADLALSERVRLLGDVGRAVAALQAVPVSADLRAFEVDWDDFAGYQATCTLQQQRREGLGEPWIEQVQPYVDRHLALARTRAGTPVLLHCELGDGVWIAQERSGRWELTGLYDFGDAMVGDPGYDLIGPPAFLARGEPCLHRSFLEGYGVASGAADEDYRRRGLLHLLLAPYSSLPWYMDVAPPPTDARTLEQLSDFWFGA